MFRRVIAIFLMLLVNIMLLMLAVLPHHHHDDAVCFVSSHCHHHQKYDSGHDDPCEEHDFCPSEASHEHDSDSSCCRMPEWIVTDTASQKHVCYSCCGSCAHDAGQQAMAILPEYLYPTVEPTGLPFRQKPVTDTYIRIFVSQIPGLRAPPFGGTQIKRG